MLKAMYTRTFNILSPYAEPCTVNIIAFEFDTQIVSTKLHVEICLTHTLSECSTPYIAPLILDFQNHPYFLNNNLASPPKYPQKDSS